MRQPEAVLWEPGRRGHSVQSYSMEIFFVQEFFPFLNWISINGRLFSVLKLEKRITPPPEKINKIKARKSESEKNEVILPAFVFNDALSELLPSGCQRPWFYRKHCSPAGCAVIARRVGTGAVRLRELGGLGVVLGPSQGASSMETQLAEQDSHQSTNKRQAGLCLRTGHTVTRSRQPIAAPQRPRFDKRLFSATNHRWIALWHHTIMN